MRKRTKTRELKDSSWLAQTLADKMEREFDANGASGKWFSLQALYVVVKEADDKENHSIYYENRDGKLSIVMCKIPSLVKHGTDFDVYGMQCKLRGLAERYKDENGMYLVSVLTTHDLNSATIKDVSSLLFEMSMDNTIE